MRSLLIFLFLFASLGAHAQIGPEQLFVRADTVLQGPAPTDTARNETNSFLEEFYRNYATDFAYFRIPDSGSETASLPDFRHRTVRPAWHLLLLATLGILAAVIVRFFRKDLRDLFEGFFTNRLINQTIREPGMLISPMAILLLILGSLALGALLYFIVPPERLPVAYHGPERFFFFVGLTVAYFLGRVAILKLTAFIFGLKEYVNSYLYILITTTGTLSFVVLVLLLMRLLAPPSLIALSVQAMQIVLLFFFVYQYTRGIWYLVSTFEFPKIYLILYLCGFEICPLLILGMGLFKS